MVLIKKFIYAQRVEGEPKETDFSLTEYDQPVALNNGDVLVEAIYHSVDPYMRVASGYGLSSNRIDNDWWSDCKVVGQIAKLKGCIVIGLTGSAEKCNRLISELNFDHAINYKTENIPKTLKQIAPDGIDCYFDNVGGTISVDIIYQIKEFGRICVCGSISSHNLGVSTLSPVRIVQPVFIERQLMMEGIQAWQYADRCMEGIQQMLEWVSDGKIQCPETVTDGFENLPKAFVDMMKGGNFGKSIVKTK